MTCMRDRWRSLLTPMIPCTKDFLLISCRYCFYSRLFFSFYFFHFDLLEIDRVFLVGVGIVQFEKGGIVSHLEKGLLYFL